MLSKALEDSTIRHSVYLEGLKTSEANKFADYLDDMAQSLEGRLFGNDLTDYSRRRMEILLESVRSDLREVYDAHGDELRNRFAEIGNYEAGFEARNLSNASGFESVAPSANQVRAAIFSHPLSVQGASGGVLLEDLVKDFSDREIIRVSNAIRGAAFEGQTNQQIMRTLRGTRANKFKDGILAISGRNAEAITRTGIQHVASVARMETWKENSDVVIGYRWLATLDSRTSAICRSLDNRVFKFDAPGSPVPPAHIRCRSTTLAELDGRFKNLSRGSQRAAGAGDVSANESYYSWLKKQGKGFQESVIGVKRAKLLRDGGLTADRFARLQLNRNFQPITLTQMKALEPLAFARAFPESGAKVIPKAIPKAKAKPKAKAERVNFDGSDKKVAEWSRTGFDSSPEPIRAQVARHSTNLKVIYKGKNAYYSAWHNEISMVGRSKYRKGGNPEATATWRHEMGHRIDDKLGYGGRQYRSSQTDFNQAQAADRLRVTQGAGKAALPGQTLNQTAAARGKAYNTVNAKMADGREPLEYLESLAKRAGVDLDETLKLARSQAGDAFPFLNLDSIKRYGIIAEDLARDKMLLDSFRQTGRMIKAIELGDAEGFLIHALAKDYPGMASRSYWGMRSDSIGFFSDLIGSTTKNKIAGYPNFPGHTTAYYADAGKAQTESFANLTALYAHPNPTWWKITKKFTPNMAKLFEKIIKLE